MTVSINDSFVAEKALSYAKLCELSKAKWSWNGMDWILDADTENLAKYQELWNSMFQKGYLVLNFWDDTQGTGYAGTLFYNSVEGRTILANRGTDGLFRDDSAAVLSIAAGKGGYWGRPTHLQICESMSSRS